VRLRASRVPHVSSSLARRITLAWIGIALWLGGVELLPNMHLAMHTHLKAPHRYLTEAPHVAIVEPGSSSGPEAAARGPPALFV